MIDTGGTIVKAAEALMADGAAGVVIAATHAILSDPAVDRLKNSPAAEVDRHQHAADPRDREFDKLTVPLHRPADLAGDQGGLRGRLGHLAVRRPRLSRPDRPAALGRFAIGTAGSLRSGSCLGEGGSCSVIDAVGS